MVSDDVLHGAADLKSSGCMRVCDFPEFDHAVHGIDAVDIHVLIQGPGKGNVSRRESRTFSEIRVCSKLRISSRFCISLILNSAVECNRKSLAFHNPNAVKYEPPLLWGEGRVRAGEGKALVFQQRSGKRDALKASPQPLPNRKRLL